MRSRDAAHLLITRVCGQCGLGGAMLPRYSHQPRIKILTLPSQATCILIVLYGGRGRPGRRVGNEGPRSENYAKVRCQLHRPGSPAPLYMTPTWRMVHCPAHCPAPGSRRSSSPSPSAAARSAAAAPPCSPAPPSAAPSTSAPGTPWAQPAN